MDMVTNNLSKVVQMGMLDKSVAFGTISPVGGVKSFEKLLLQLTALTGIF